VAQAAKTAADGMVDAGLGLVESVAGQIESLADTMVDQAEAEVEADNAAMTSLVGDVGGAILAAVAEATDSGSVGSHANAHSNFSSNSSGLFGSLSGWVSYEYNTWAAVISNPWEAMAGAGQGAYDGAAMAVNAVTLGLNSELNDYVNKTIDTNGGVYSTANNFAIAGGCLFDAAVIVEVAGAAIPAMAAGGAGAGGSELSLSEQRAVASLQQRIVEHQQKLSDYIRNPDAFDNLGFLKNAPTPEIRERIIQGRINHLNQEINAFQNQINQILQGQ
jgi:hypothetical protein